MTGSAPSALSRIVVTGGPRAGKTTFARALADQLGTRLRHTDELVGQLPWSEASDAVVDWLEEPGPWIIDGVTALRALRKWMDRHGWGPPADIVYWGNVPVVTRNKGQQTLAKGCDTIWGNVRPLLIARNVQVLDFPTAFHG